MHKSELAVRARLNKKVCMNCGALNAPKAVKCRKCHRKNLRPKSREIKK